ncbi:hypothetical protein EVAR_58208_1 [Eumeta japonica]|uniref:Ricin B lectin domain-containing protein n=1 Tax=Eumeta variegata TaxID=151549 RepID=A0A4C1YQJ3_EUMVA|nr:hypothetical protein EVAR_58208_1 [Eumeta japonica]
MQSLGARSHRELGKWVWVRGGRLQHVESRLCLDARGAGVSGARSAEAGARPCRSATDPHQLWLVDYSQANNYTLPGQ